MRKILVTIALLFALNLPVKAADSSLPKLEIGDITASQDTIFNQYQGQFKATSQNDNSISNIYFTVALTRDRADTKTLDNIQIVTLPDYYSFTAKQSQIIQFNLPIPVFTASGDYLIGVKAYNQTGLILQAGFSDNFTYTAGAGYKEGLDIDWQKNFLDKDGQQLQALTGPNYAAGVSPVAEITVNNRSDSAISAIPVATVYPRAKTPGVSPVNTRKYAAVLVEAKSDRKVLLKLPAQTTPESYLAEVTFSDANGITLSSPQQFRYVVIGVSGKVLSIQGDGVEKRLFQSIVKLKTVVIGPAANDAIVENASLKVSLVNSGGKTITSQTQSLGNVYRTAVPVSVALKYYSWRAPSSVTAKVELLDKDGKVLDSSTGRLDFSVSQWPNLGYLVVLLLVLLFGGAAAVGVWRLKRMAKGGVKVDIVEGEKMSYSEPAVTAEIGDKD